MSPERQTRADMCVALPFTSRSECTSLLQAELVSYERDGGVMCRAMGKGGILRTLYQYI